MSDIRSRFEEIWPVPERVYWSEHSGFYLGECGAAIEHNARLETFIRCQEMMAERQEPAAFMTVHPNGMKGLFFPSKNIDPSPYDHPLYTSPPSPVAVALPERDEYSGINPMETARQEGWNACLDKTKELNKCLPISDKKTGD